MIFIFCIGKKKLFKLDTSNVLTKTTTTVQSCITRIVLMLENPLSYLTHNYYFTSGFTGFNIFVLFFSNLSLFVQFLVFHEKTFVKLLH